MPNAELCTKDEITRMVYSFYDKVRHDEVLGPVFNRHVADWDAHLPTMVDFWSSALRGTARFRGAPMPKHAALPGLSIELFQRWLVLFGQRAQNLAKRIAQSLWYGYPMSQDADRPAVGAA